MPDADPENKPQPYHKMSLNNASFDGEERCAIGLWMLWCGWQRFGVFLSFLGVFGG